MDKNSPLDAFEPSRGPLGRAARVEARTAGRIYLEYGPLLRRVAIRKFDVPPSEADALVHDVFVSWLVSGDRVRTDLRGYLIGSICNASRNYWRSRRSERRVFADHDSPVDDVVAKDVFVELERMRLVSKTLKQLASRCREVLRRYYLDGENTAAIAAAMETTPANVNYLMHVCRKRARAIYETLTKAG